MKMGFKKINEPLNLLLRGLGRLMGLGTLNPSTLARSLCGIATSLTLLTAPLVAERDWASVITEWDRAVEDGNTDRAEQLLNEAAAQARSFTANDRRRPQLLVRLARLYRAEGDFAKPERLYGQAARSAETAWGSESAEYAELLHEIGQYYHTRRKFELAEGYYLDSFGIRARIFGKEHLEVAQSINNLAVLFENQARYDKSETYFRSAIEIRTKLLGEDALPTIETKEHFARMLLSMRRAREAQQLLEHTRSVRRSRLNKLTANRVDLGTVYTADSGAKPPEVQRRFAPEYTPEGRFARHEGDVSVEIEIDSEGVPRNFRVLSILGLGLDEKAVEAVRQWRFKPARLNGAKVPFRAVLDVNFRLL